MKKTKKALAFVLAMMMVFSLMAVTAAAYDAEEHHHECAACCEDEGIMPMHEVNICPWCGGAAEYHPDTDLHKIWVVCLNRDLCGRCGWL